MDRTTRTLMTKTLQGRVALLRRVCAAHSSELKSQKLNLKQKSAVADQWETALKEWRSLRFTLDQLGKAERADQG
jgi:hypothetical protein